MLTREMYSPAASMNKLLVPVPVANGGTAGADKVVAVHNLGGIPRSEANIANGWAQLDATSKLPSSLFPVEAQGGPTIIGPSTLLIQSRGDFFISNYDSQETYTISCTQGFVTRSKDHVYYTAPAIEGTYGFTINNKQVQVIVSAHYVAQPTLISPANTVAALSGALLTDTLYASDRVSGDGFGITVLISADGSRLAVGAHTKIINGVVSAGQVYVYTRSGTTWNLETTLSASDKAANDFFGVSVSFDSTATRMVVGAHGKDPGATTDAGQVYIYTRSGTNWVLESVLFAADKTTNDLFGVSVALTADGARLAVGAYNKAVGGIAAAGQVYTYTRVGSVWTQETTISATDKAASDGFGRSVSFDSTGVRLAIGAYARDSSSLVDSGAVYIYTRSGSVYTQEAVLTASDKAANDYFGVSAFLSTDGTRLVVGAKNKDTNTLIDIGKIYIYIRSGTIWSEEFTLLPNDNTHSDSFGTSVALSANGLQLITGVVTKDSNDVLNCGAVLTYTLQYNTTSKVRQPATIQFTSSPFTLSGQYLESTITASDKAVGDNFGRSIAISADGSRMAVGAHSKTVGGTVTAGQVYIYTRSNNAWVLETTITASDKAASDALGISVALDGTGGRLIIGIRGRTVAGLAGAGQVNIYTRSGTTWTLESTLTASDKATGDNFGQSVALTPDGSRLAVGAHGKTVSAITGAGKVYIYNRAGSIWTEESTLSASDKATSDFFGVAVALDSAGSRLAVGAHSKTVGGLAAAGQAYTYTRSGTVWTQEAIITASDKAASDQFGVTLTFDSTATRLAIGAYNKTVNNVTGAGQVYVYTRSGSVYTLETTLSASDKTINDNFGISLAFNTDGSYLAIGATSKDYSADLYNTGQVYNYLMSYHVGTDWQLAADPGFVNITTQVVNDNINRTSWQVTDLIAATDYFVRCRHKGSTYLYSDWSPTYKLTTRDLFLPITEQAIITASDKAASDAFGISVSISGDGTRMAVGASNKTVGGLAAAGQVYIFTRSGLSWTQESVVTASDKVANDQFGRCVSLDSTGLRLAVGSYTKTAGGVTGAGQVYVYTRSGSTWTQESTLTASDKATSDYFGVAVAFDSNASRMAVGASNKTVSGTTGAGQVYIYTRSGSSWSQESTLTASDKATGDAFGITISLTADGSRMAVGAYNKTVGGVTQAGQAYVYTRSGATWTEEAKISAADKVAGDAFGIFLALDSTGSRLYISADLKTVGGITGAGQVYVYTRSGSIWNLETTLSASDKAANDHYGAIGLTANDSILAVGAFNKTAGGLASAGVVYILS